MGRVVLRGVFFGLTVCGVGVLLGQVFLSALSPLGHPIFLKPRFGGVFSLCTRIGLNTKTAGSCGRPAVVVASGRRADAVYDAVEFLRGAWFPKDPTIENEGHGVEEAPGVRCAFLHLLEGGGFPFMQDLGDASHVEHVRAVELHDGVVGLWSREHGRAVATEGSLLQVTGIGEGFDYLTDKARKVALGVCRVLAPDDVVCHERHVVATEDVPAEADSDGELLVVGVAQGNRVFVAPVGGLEHHHAEVAHAVLGDAVGFRDNLVAVEGEGVTHHVDEPVVRDGDVGGGSLGGFDVAQGGIVDGVRPTVKHERHGRSPVKEHAVIHRARVRR